LTADLGGETITAMPKPGSKIDITPEERERRRATMRALNRRKHMSECYACGAALGAVYVVAIPDGGVQPRGYCPACAPAPLPAPAPPPPAPPAPPPPDDWSEFGF